MPSAIPQTALTLPLYKKNELVRELRQSILPWGILELAIDLQEVFGDAQTDESGKLNPESVSPEGIQKLNDFVIYLFEDKVSREELNRQVILKDMFAVYAQIFTMVGQVMKSYDSAGGQQEQDEASAKIKNWARRIKYMLLDTGKLGVLRDIELTDFRSVLRFMYEYQIWKNEQLDPKTYVPGDLTDFA